MGHSSLLGTDHAAAEPAGRDTATLGPGDSSDSGSDMAGIADTETSDPGAPVDVAMRDDMPHSLLPGDSLSGSASDAAGTGERRSAGDDAGTREAADIGVDRVFTPGRRRQAGDPRAAADETLSDDEDADLAFVDEAQAGDPLEDESSENDDGEENEGGLQNEDDGVPGGQGDQGGGAGKGSGGPARSHAQQTPQPAPGRRPNPEPDGSAPAPDPDRDDETSPPADESDADEHKPGRT